MKNMYAVIVHKTRVSQTHVYLYNKNLIEHIFVLVN